FFCFARLAPISVECAVTCPPCADFRKSLTSDGEGQLNSALQRVAALRGDFDIPTRRKKRIDEIYAYIVPMIVLIEEDMLSRTARANSDRFDPNRSDAFVHLSK